MNQNQKFYSNFQNTLLFQTMRTRSRSVFQNYENFQAWQEVPQASHYNLLTKLNSNLNNYQNKYKKYMNIKENQLKAIHHFLHKVQTKEKGPKDIPFLPLLKNESNVRSILQSQQFNKVKVVVKQQIQLRDSQIFCQRSNNHLKLKTISFEKQKRKRHPFQKRKLSLHQNNQLYIQKFFNKQNQDLHEQIKKHQSAPKMMKLKALQCKQLKHRFKKANKKGKLYAQIQQQRGKQNNQHIFFQRKSNLESIVQELQKDKYDLKSNQFSDKKFYQQYSKQKYKMQR